MPYVIVKPYNPQWPQDFLTIQNYLWPFVKHVALGIEHVGSTSVPKLAAKPVIDLDIIIASEAELAEIIRQLEPVGYTYRGDLGIAGRYAFKQPNHLPRHNLYVCPQASIGLRNHLALRDYLRNNPEAVTAYSTLKLSLAKQFPNDIDRYIDGKTELISQFLQAAGISEAERTAIAEANRLKES